MRVLSSFIHPFFCFIHSFNHVVVLTLFFLVEICSALFLVVTPCRDISPEYCAVIALTPQNETCSESARLLTQIPIDIQTDIHIHIQIYIYIERVCVCVWEREREREKCDKRTDRRETQAKMVEIREGEEGRKEKKRERRRGEKRKKSSHAHTWLRNILSCSVNSKLFLK